jgi:hypothetical protein
LYQTRFIVKLQMEQVADLAGYVTTVIKETDIVPSSVNLGVDESDATAVGTVVYHTTTTSESDCVIGAWRAINPRIQVERVHQINPDQFESIALAGRNGRALRRALSRNVRELCVRGVGSKGILDYLDECESIVLELKDFVQSQRAPV